VITGAIGTLSVFSQRIARSTLPNSLTYASIAYRDLNL